MCEKQNQEVKKSKLSEVLRRTNVSSERTLESIKQTLISGFKADVVDSFYK